jgi:hypothetical protein
MPDISNPIRIDETTVERIASSPDDASRKLMLSRRQALIIELGAIEDYLSMERSIIPKRKRPDELRHKFDHLTRQS